MAAVMPDRQPSPNPATRTTQGLSINLSSNNPFRNRAVSPAGASPRSLDAPPSRDNRMSRNPFLDASEFNSPPSKDVSGLTADIFNDLSLLDKPANGAANGPPPLRAPPRAGTMPVNGTRPPGPPGDRLRGPPPPRAPGSPDKREPPRRPRGLSDSSVMDKERDSRRERERSERTTPRTESEERRRRERRREREERHRREKEKVRNGGRMKKPQGLDIIDKLDVTGIYGQGLFHHDGPFDACNPHRNAKKDRRAPMQAFPANSANMALGGGGPVNSRLDLDRFHGRGEEAFETFTATRKAQPTVIDPTARDVIHSQESDGLGTSTFLEGAPASRRDLQRRDSEEPAFGSSAPASGLGRKKSIAQRFRGMSNSRRQPGAADFRSPDARYNPANDTSPPRAGVTQSAGGPARAKFTKENEINPFENDYENAYEKKGAQIRIAEQEKPLMGGSRAAPTSPRGGNGLTRSVTADSAVPPGSGGAEEQKSSGGGFLSRMKSLKGGRRTRPERRDS